MATIDPRIVGTWRMKSTMGLDDAGNVLEPPYGPAAMGLVVFQASLSTLSSTASSSTP